MPRRPQSTRLCPVTCRAPRPCREDHRHRSLACGGAGPGAGLGSFRQARRSGFSHIPALGLRCRVLRLGQLLPRVAVRFAISGWRRHEAQEDNFEVQAGDPQHEPGQGCLVWQFGAKGCRTWANGYLAVVEFRAQRGACLAAESDLIRWGCHQVNASQSPVHACGQHAWPLSLHRHPPGGDPGR